MFGISWQVAVLFSGLLAAVSQSLGKRQVEKYSAVVVEFWRALGVILSLVVFGGLGLEVFELQMAGWIMLYGGFSVFGLAAYLAASRVDFSGTSVLSYSLSQLGIVGLSAVVLGEWVYFDVRVLQGKVNLLALVLALMVFYLYAGRGEKRKHKYSWLGMLLFSISFNVVGNVFVKYALSLGVSSLAFLFWSYLGGLGGAFVVLKLRGQKIWLRKVRDFGESVMYGVVGVLGVFVYLEVLQKEPLSLASLVRRMATVSFSVMSGLFLFEERKKLKMRQMVGLGLGLVVVGLLMGVNR